MLMFESGFDRPGILFERNHGGQPAQKGPQVGWQAVGRDNPSLQSNAPAHLTGLAACGFQRAEARSGLPSQAI
jgi:hypothetical protein